ncbi:MAG TPA: hypothetical protein VMS22_09190 [Candidatus Eisenbacteria bacterium]|nr:hypothetical protein [Candidatus Eisenbacteria bacterium]
MTRQRSSVVISAALLVFAAGTWASAEVLCKNKKGVLASRTTCKGKETTVDPAALGLVGPKGDKGDKGDAAARWAVVKDDGTIAAQSGGITVDHPNPGEYYVGFGSGLEGKTLSVTAACLDATCIFSGAPQANICGGGPAGGDCNPLFDDTSHVGVFIQNTTQSALQNAPFHIAVF